MAQKERRRPDLITGQIRFSPGITEDQVRAVAEELRASKRGDGFKFLCVRHCGTVKKEDVYGIGFVYQMSNGELKTFKKIVYPLIGKLADRFRDNVSWDITNRNLVLVG